VFQQGIERQALEQFAISRGLITNIADKWWRDDSIGSAVGTLKLLGVLTDTPINMHFQVNVKPSLANIAALQVLASGGSQEEIFKAKRDYAEKEVPEIGTLYKELKKRDARWRKANDKLSAGNDDTPTMKRAGWVRSETIKCLGSVCQITGDPVYVDAKDNGIDASHIVPLEVAARYGYKHFDSPHGMRLLRVDLHRRNDSGVAFAKNHANLRTPPEFKDSHDMADKLREWLDLLESTQPE